MSHPDTLRLAAYLDGALAPDELAEMHAHTLRCAACAARLEQLRADERRLRAFASLGAAPDVRANVRMRLHRRPALRLLPQGLALGGVLVVLLAFALLVSTARGGTVGPVSERLFIVDRDRDELVALDAANGAELGSLALGRQPLGVRYSPLFDRLYVAHDAGVVAVDPHKLTIVARWPDDQPASGARALALDERRGALYMALADGTLLTLDAATLQTASTRDIALDPPTLALAPDGGTLFGLDAERTRLVGIRLDTSQVLTQPLDPAVAGQRAWLAAATDNQSVFLLHAGPSPQLVRVNLIDGTTQRMPLRAGPAPWGLVLLDDGSLAVPRGDGSIGGVEVFDAQTLTVMQRIDPEADQHAVVAGADHTLFALNWLHGTVTRYALGREDVLWQVRLDGRQPWDGVYMPGGWRWPFSR